MEKKHKSGFVNIIGQPNVGKSTLMNALVGERMSIITSKPQTTRHRILGILNEDNYQLIFSDTPGVVNDPRYKMHNSMNKFVESTFHDGDLMIFVTDPYETYDEDAPIIEKLNKVKVPVFIVLNKMDLVEEERVDELLDLWKARIPNHKFIIKISALKKINTETLLDKIIEYTPEAPAYYPKDQLTDRPERFFISEIIREQLLIQYRQEIPYSCEVIVESFKETQTNKGEDIVKIRAEIYVSRKTQKSIIIGKGGIAIKKLGTESRKSIVKFLDSKVHLELYVRVKENWRDDDKLLQNFGY